MFLGPCCRSLNLQRLPRVSVGPHWVWRGTYLLLEVTHKFSISGCQPSTVSTEHLVPPLVTPQSLLPSPSSTLNWPLLGLPQLRHYLLALEGTGSRWNLSQRWAASLRGCRGVWHPGQGCSGCGGSGKQWHAPCCWWRRWSLALPTASCFLTSQYLFEGTGEEKTTKHQRLCYSTLKMVSSAFHPSSLTIRSLI